MRSSSACLVRKGLKFSKDVVLHRAAAAWDDLVYNLARPLRTLRQRLADEGQRRWRSRTRPAPRESRRWPRSWSNSTLRE